MANLLNISKPSVSFEVSKIIAISANDGRCRSYQVQWAPSWISELQLVGCEDLIKTFEHQQTKNRNIKAEEIDENYSQDLHLLGLDESGNSYQVNTQVSSQF